MASSQNCIAAKSASATVVSILETFPEEPTSGDVIRALVRAESAGAGRVQDQLQARDTLLIDAMVWLEAAGKALAELRMPMTGTSCLEKATQIRALLGMQR